MKNWIKSEIEPNEIVLSSRIRLARNLKDIPFPHKLDTVKAREVIENIETHLKEDNNNLSTIKLWENNNTENKLYLEKHLISNKLLDNSEKAAFIVDEEETVSVMINEEDHLRIQAITSGFDLKDAYNRATSIDDLIESKEKYAFNESLGYLTACPTNCGTGLRASVMIHLPALSMEKEISRVLNSLSQVGITIRGLYGEGSKVQGNLYQISNQITLGVTEEEVISNLTAVLEQVKNSEFATREKINKYYHYELKDKIFRSLGILKSAVILSFGEALELLSNVRLGIELGLIKSISHSFLSEILIESSPSYISSLLSENNEKAINLKRAELIRNKLKSL